jgi:23S rRNA (cytosine1962-C5)-methyltransferase
MPTKIYLRKKISDRIAQGHPWVFANEIGDVEGFEKAGAIVSVFSSNGSLVGIGYYNPESKISVRLLSKQTEVAINREFFLKRIKKACDFRQDNVSGNFKRLISGEADALPGLEVDLMQHYLVFRIYTLGMELWKETIVSCMGELFPGYFIYEKNEGRFRQAESLPVCSGFWGNSGVAKFQFEDSGVQVLINLEDPSRSGLYWEQMIMSDLLKPFVEGKRILDAFCFQGFALFKALKMGAQSAMGLDWSEKNIEYAEKNKLLNGCHSEIRFLAGNSFSKLRQLANEKLKFDIIILDPPAMAAVRKSPDNALSGYEKLLDASIDLLDNGGLLLLTVSGHQILENLVMEVMNSIVLRKSKQWRIVSTIAQPPDHPVLWEVATTQYFSGWLLEIWQGDGDYE